MQLKQYITSIFTSVVAGVLFAMAADAQEFYHDSVLDGFVCQSASQVFETKSESRLDCAATCSMEVNCESVFYHEGSTSCFGCSDILTEIILSLDGKPGTEYFRPYARYQMACSPVMKPCVSAINNTCDIYFNICTCILGHTYNPTTKACTIL